MRPTRAEINLTQLKINISEVKKLLNSKPKIMGIVKANAYGCGLVEISKSMVENGIDYLGVGFLEEGIQLRTNGIISPILVLGGVLGDQIEKFLAFDFEITVSSFELAQKINNEVQKNGKRKARIHLKIDTGMERLGVNFKHGVEFVERVARLKNLEIVGIFSHFATADDFYSKNKNSFAHIQLQNFNYMLIEINKLKIEIPFKHIANSSATLFNSETHFNLIRPGIIFYGILDKKKTVKNNLNIFPILSFKSKIVFLKEVKKNTSISYGRTFFTNRNSKIATIPVGYGDGYYRTLSNKADVLINGKRCPIVGTICMDQMMVDVTNCVNVHIGDDVVLIGKNQNDEITIEELAKISHTISYEILTNISQRVPRVYLN